MLKKIFHFFRTTKIEDINSHRNRKPLPNPITYQSPIQNPKTPHWCRIQQVYTVLETAPPNLTYDQLIHHVRETTGKGCSRKLIAKWKKQRATRY